MDWADDVAYSVHDVDGIHARHVRLADLAGADERAAVCEQATAVYSTETPADLAAVLTDLLALASRCASWPATTAPAARRSRSSGPPATTWPLRTAAVTATRSVAGDRPLARYQADPVVPRRVAAERALFKAVAARYVMRRRRPPRWRPGRREVVTELARPCSPTGHRQVPGAVPGLAGCRR